VWRAQRSRARRVRPGGELGSPSCSPSIATSASRASSVASAETAWRSAGEALRSRRLRHHSPPSARASDHTITYESYPTTDQPAPHLCVAQGARGSAHLSVSRCPIRFRASCRSAENQPMFTPNVTAVGESGPAPLEAVSGRTRLRKGAGRSMAPADVTGISARGRACSACRERPRAVVTGPGVELRPPRRSR
jgi:hypothetical protein